MAVMTVDTLKLKATGISGAQAKAESDALQGMLAKTLDSQLTTKTDLINLECRIDGINAKIDQLDTRISGELSLLKWMIGLVLGGILALVLREFFPVQ
jgi:hypothetical protein